MDMNIKLEKGEADQILLRVKEISLQKGAQSKNLYSQQTLLWRLYGPRRGGQTLKYILTDLRSHVL